MRKVKMAMLLSAILAIGIPGQVHAAPTEGIPGAVQSDLTAVSTHGALRVDGANLVDSKGEKY